MTRINLVTPSMLTDKHLLAEYKEITRPLTRLRKYLNAGKKPPMPTSKTYILGTGHETFFIDKMAFLYVRYRLLCKELLARGVNIDDVKFSLVCASFETISKSHREYFNVYHPTPEEIYLNMARLVRRSNLPNVLIEMLSKD